MNSTKLPGTPVAGIQIYSAHKQELLFWVEQRVNSSDKTFLATPYGEFLYESLRNPEFRYVLGAFNANIADGVSVQWASVFLNQGSSLAAKDDPCLRWYSLIARVFWQVVITGSWILLQPKKIRQFIPEKITGSDFFWDLAELSSKNNWSVMLAGGFGDTVEIVKEKLLTKFPKLNIVGTSNVEVKDACFIPSPSWGGLGRGGGTEEGTAQLPTQIQTLKPDVLFLCLGPFKQERFLIYNKEQLPVKLAIGLGGTFDYVAGKKTAPPKFIRQIGLEWLFRLFTQPKRIGRIYNATVGLVLALVKYKAYQSKPYRPNVALVIINSRDQILICRRNYKRENRYTRLEEWNTVHWQLPQGGIDSGESPEQTAIREAKEETGLEDLQIIKVAPKAHEYIFPSDNLPLLGPNPYKGQSQTLVYLKCSDDPEKVHVDGREFDSYTWVERDELIDKVHVVRKELAKGVIENWPGVANP